MPTTAPSGHEIPQDLEGFNPSSPAAQAFQAYAAMCRMEKDDPSILDNPFWVERREQAFAMFKEAYGAE